MLTRMTPASIDMSNRATTSANSTAVPASTMGTRTGMAAEQYRHFPRSYRKLNTGILSISAMGCLQVGQWEAGTRWTSLVGASQRQR
jgi:hypothetical protein